VSNRAPLSVAKNKDVNKKPADTSNSTIANKASSTSAKPASTRIGKGGATRKKFM